MMTEKSIGFIGGGRITRIFLEAFRRSRAVFREIVVSDPEANRLADLQAGFPEIRASTSNAGPAAKDYVFAAVHPPVLPQALREISGVLSGEAIVISLAPKVSIRAMSESLAGFSRIVRLIPNAPSLIQEGYNPVSFSSALSPGDRTALREVFRSLGESPEVPEEDLEAYAVLAAMGPTYFWFQWLELERLGRSFGLSAEDARRALGKMTEGAVRTLFSSGLSAERVLDLIPVKPLEADQDTIRQIYASRLEPLFKKLKA
jgi:pyrroline-5-carboxylate reductase